MEVSRIEIPLSFENYKLIESAEFNLNGSHIYFIEGSNNKGKTSVKTAIASLMTAKNVTDEPVTRGQKKGHVSGILPAADGNQYQVDWRFTNEKSVFEVTKPDGKKISSVNEIRDLFKYTHFSISEFLSWSLSAEGVRKQQKIILNLLSQEARDKYDLLSAQESEFFDSRKDKKKELDILKKQISSLSKEDELLLTNEAKSLERITQLESQLKELYNQNSKLLKLRERVEKFQAAMSVCDLEDKKQSALETDLSICIASINKSIESLPKDCELEIEKINAAIKSGNEYIAKINSAKAKKTVYDEQNEKIVTAEKELSDLEKDLDSVRQQKKKLILDAKLPFDIEMTEEGITIDGFKFSEHQVCRSKAVKVVAALMCAINPSPILLLDEVNSLDNQSLEELHDLAKEKGKIMIFDKVVPIETELCVTGYDLV